MASNVCFPNLYFQIPPKGLTSYSNDFASAPGDIRSYEEIVVLASIPKVIRLWLDFTDSAFFLVR